MRPSRPKAEFPLLTNLTPEVWDGLYPSLSYDPPDLDLSPVDMSQKVGDLMSRCDLGVHSVVIKNGRVACRSQYAGVTFDLETETSTGTIKVFILTLLIWLSPPGSKLALSPASLHPMLVSEFEKLNAHLPLEIIFMPARHWQADRYGIRPPTSSIGSDG